MSSTIFIFECSNATYLDCVQKCVFGSNLPWPLEIKEGDSCYLYHYEVGTLFALWQAVTNGGKNLVPRAWGGRFPFQVKVALSSPDIIEIPKARVPKQLMNSSTGKFINVFSGRHAEEFLMALKNPNEI